MIVTPEGLNVFPEDVERVLDDAARRRESAVVGVAGTRGACPRGTRLESGTTRCDRPRRQPQAPGPSAGPRGVGVARATELPRTEGTRKLRRRVLRDWVASGEKPAAVEHGDTLESLIAHFAHGREISGATTLEELGLSSLERVELMMALEDRFQTRLEEGRFSEVASVASSRSW
jgi:long-chain acyl-CoA synthetase